MERRSGKQRRRPLRLLKKNSTGRRLEDLEFSVFLKIALATIIILFGSIASILFIN